MKFWARLLAGLILVMVVGGCASSKRATTKDKPGQTPEAIAIDLAEKEFLKTGRSLDKYRVSVQNDRNGGRWVVWFERKDENPPPGTTFVVNVDKASGRASLAR